MHSVFLATLALAVLPGTFEDRRTAPDAPVPPSGAAVVAAAPLPIEPEPAPALADTLPAELASPAKGAPDSPLRGLLLPGGALLALGGVALLFTLRKSRNHGSLRILESVSVGPKRSLVVARVGDDELVLGCSEAGISLLTKRPHAERGEPAGEWPSSPTRAPSTTATDLVADEGRLREAFGTRSPAGTVAGSLGRLFRKGGRPDFDDLLADSAQDQELRRRLASGSTGRIG